MSRRFGRNQRRKLRERVASLEEAYAREALLTRQVRERKDYLEQVFREMTRLLGEYSAFLPPRREPGPMHRVPLRPFPMSCVPFDETRPPRRFEVEVIDLQHVKAWVEHHADVLRSVVHLLIDDPAEPGRLSYAVSDMALFKARRHPAYLDELSRFITREFDETLKHKANT